jgi:membrane associated rhomboid family serine protease
LTIREDVVAILVVVGVVLGLVLRGMSSEERLKFGQAVVDGLVFIKDSIAKPPKGGEAFYRALEARTKWALVTPAIVVSYIVVFILLLAGSGSLGDPRTLVDWGSSIGTRTTNDEWWRLATALFVHVGVIHLIAEIAGLVQIGLLVERLVGRLAFVVVYVASGVLAGVWSLTLHPVSIQAGASGAIFGVYGLLLATLVLGLAQRTSLAVPVNVLKGLWPGVAVFLVYNTLTEGVFSEAMQAGFVVGFTGGMLIAGRVISDKPPARRVLAVVATTVAIVVALAAPLRGLADVSGEVAKVKEGEERTARTYDTAVDRFKSGRLSAQELARLADRIVSELQSIQTQLVALDNVPAEHWPMVEKACEYLKLRQDSWRLRAEGLRAGRARALQDADVAEHSALIALAIATAPIQP